MLYTVTLQFANMPGQNVLSVEATSFAQAETKAIAFATAANPTQSGPYVLSMTLVSKVIVR